MHSPALSLAEAKREFIAQFGSAAAPWYWAAFTYLKAYRIRQLFSMTKEETHTIQLSPAKRSAIIKAISAHVQKRFVNVAGVNLEAWKDTLNRAEPELLTMSTDEFENGIREHLKGLKSSHTAFYHGFHARFLPQHSINATLKSIGSNGDARWMFLDVFPEGPAAKAGIVPGQILLAIDGETTAPPEMPTLTTGRDYRLLVSGGGNGATREVALPVPFRKGTKGAAPYCGTSGRDPHRCS